MSQSSVDPQTQAAPAAEAPTAASPTAAGTDAPAGIDPRGPRFGAAISAVLLLTVVALSLAAAETAALIGLAAISALFAWGAFAGIQRHPYGLLFTKFVRPRLAAPPEWEDPRPPTFAQGVGFVVTAIGVLLGLLAIPAAVGIAAAAAFVAAFLNAVFGYCIGCQLYVLLLRLRG